MGRLLTRVSRILRARWLRASGAAERWTAPEADPAREPGPGPSASDASGDGRRPVDALRRARAVLEIGPEASAEEIRAAYRRLCRRYHPDYFAGDPERSRDANELLAEINAAYELLSGSRA